MLAPQHHSVLHASVKQPPLASNNKMDRGPVRPRLSDYGGIPEAGSYGGTSDTSKALSTSTFSSSNTQNSPYDARPAPPAIVSVTYDTFDDMTQPAKPTLTPPPNGASQEERMEYIKKQVEGLMGGTIFHGLVLQEGSGTRLEGGTCLPTCHFCSSS